MVNLGPQLVQLMKGYPCRRSAGSSSSRRQSAQVAVSAETSVRRGPVASLAAMTKNSSERAGLIARVVIFSILASGGASRSSRRRNSATAAGGPSTSAKTPLVSLPTRPVRPRPVAREYTNGRKPTPWTTPATRTAVRTVPAPPAPHLPLARLLVSLPVSGGYSRVVQSR